MHNLLISSPGPTLIKIDEINPWIKDQQKITHLFTILPLELQNFAPCYGYGIIWHVGGQALPHAK